MFFRPGALVDGHETIKEHSVLHMKKKKEINANVELVSSVFQALKHTFIFIILTVCPVRKAIIIPIFQIKQLELTEIK